MAEMSANGKDQCLHHYYIGDACFLTLFAFGEFYCAPHSDICFASDIACGQFGANRISLRAKRAISRWQSRHITLPRGKISLINNPSVTLRVPPPLTQGRRKKHSRGKIIDAHQSKVSELKTAPLCKGSWRRRRLRDCQTASFFHKAILLSACADGFLTLEKFLSYT